MLLRQRMYDIGVCPQPNLTAVFSIEIFLVLDSSLPPLQHPTPVRRSTKLLLACDSGSFRFLYGFLGISCALRISMHYQSLKLPHLP